MFHFWLEDATVDVFYSDDALFSQDGNFLLQMLQSVPPAFGAICLQMVDQIVAKNMLFKYIHTTLTL